MKMFIAGISDISAGFSQIGKVQSSQVFTHLDILNTMNTDTLLLFIYLEPRRLKTVICYLKGY